MVGRISDMTTISRKYDLEERTAKFEEDVINFCRQLSKDRIVEPLIIQLVKSATSCGANYSEADDAESKRDFRHKIGICKKETRESKHFLRMIAVTVPDAKQNAQTLWQEAKELNLIFNSIYHKLR